MEPNRRKRRRSRAGGYGCLTALLLFLAFFVVIPILRGSGHPDIDHEVHEFPGVESDEEISIGLDSDDEGRIHLAWSEAGHGIRYATSDNGGVTWTAPIQVSNDPIIVDLFVDDDSMVVFSSQFDDIKITVSTDGGASWSELHRLDYRVSLVHLDLLRDGRHLYLSFLRDGVVYFLQSDDFGESWSDPIGIAELAGHVAYRTLTLAGSKYSLFVSWVERPSSRNQSNETRTKRGRGESPILVQSLDGGRTWSRPEDLSRVFITESRPVYGSGGTAVATKDNIFVAFGTRKCGLMGTFRPIKGGSWSRPQRFPEETTSLDEIVATTRDDIVFLGNVNTRFREYEPIGYIWLPPFYSMLGWWNNDLSLLTANPEGSWDDKVVTPPASRVSHTYIKRSKRLLIVHDDLFLFWTGRRKVGQRLDTFGYKEQIFWVKFDLESLY